MNKEATAAIVMPSSYALMDEEEMMYVEGGGTVHIVASVSTVRKVYICTFSNY